MLVYIGTALFAVGIVGGVVSWAFGFSNFGAAVSRAILKLSQKPAHMKRGISAMYVFGAFWLIGLLGLMLLFWVQHTRH